MIKWLFLIIFFTLTHIPAKATLLLKVPVYILEGSPWTKDEVSNFLQIANSIYKEQCGIEFQFTINTMVAPDMLELETTETEKGFLKNEDLVRRTGNLIRPIMFFVNKSSIPWGVARAHIPTSMTSKIVYESLGDERVFNSPLVGAVIISNYFQSNQRYKHSNPFEYSVEAHELGHVLLNDPGHDHARGNIMSINSYANFITLYQCKKMKSKNPLIKQ